jgi:hypothetical protein
MISLNEILKRVNSTNSNNIYLAFVELNQLKNKSSILTAISSSSSSSSIIDNQNNNDMNRILNQSSIAAVDAGSIDEYSFNLNNNLVSTVTSSDDIMTTRKKVNQVQKDRYAYSYQPGNLIN